MKILYGIQGTGHGHISRARELLPELRKQSSVDVLISGSAVSHDLNGGTALQKHGFSLTYDSNGGVSVLDTLRDFRPIRFITDIQSTAVEDYDLVISDYEPITSWAAKLADVPAVALSHQASFLSPNTPRPARKSLIAEVLLHHFAPADHAIGFHFRQYDDFVEPPIIRSAIRELNVSKANHITVYLPAYHHEVLQNLLAPFTHIDWHIFSPFCNNPQKEQQFWIYPVSNQPFLDSFASCSGLVCNAGFETCAEAMYLGKKLLAIPIRRQYEQECNAAALRKLDITILKTLRDQAEEIWYWLEEQQAVPTCEVADTSKVVEQILTIGSRENGQSRKSNRSFFQTAK